MTTLTTKFTLKSFWAYLITYGHILVLTPTEHVRLWFESLSIKLELRKIQDEEVWLEYVLIATLFRFQVTIKKISKLCIGTHSTSLICHLHFGMDLWFSQARKNIEDGNLDAILATDVKTSQPTPSHDSLWKVADIALQSVEPIGIHRPPTMTTVLQELHLALSMEEAASVQEPFGPYHYSTSSNTAPTPR